jgi:hypothetical protein
LVIYRKFSVAGETLFPERLGIPVAQVGRMLVTLRHRIGAAQSVAAVFVVVSPSFIRFCLSG